MEDKPLSFELKVGIFVFIGIAIMFIFVFSIGEFYLLKPTYNVNVLFDFANGIEIGAPVRLAGVEIGEVDDIAIFYDMAKSKTRVRVELRLQKKAVIEKDSVCMINTLGLLGEKYLEITPGSKEAGFVEPESTMTGRDPIPMEEVTETMKDLADAAKGIAASTSIIVDRLERGEGTIGKLLVDEAVYNNLEAFTEDIKKNPWKLLYRSKGRTRDKRSSEAGPKKNF
ncbi:MAG: MlaD family protein [Candidatus Omnitrophota bacterium]